MGNVECRTENGEWAGDWKMANGNGECRINREWGRGMENGEWGIIGLQVLFLSGSVHLIACSSSYKGGVYGAFLESAREDLNKLL